MRKILNNFGFRTLAVLGPVQYLALIATLLRIFPQVLRTRNLGPLDRAFARRLKLRYRGATYVIDCKAIDALANENSSTFGAVREIFIRDCYLRFLPTPGAPRFATVVDLGANRGVFTLQASKFADRVVSVEGQPRYQSCSKKLADDNGQNNVRSLTAMVGGVAKLNRRKAAYLSLTELLDREGVDRVDLLKVDIEGSEFGLFADPSALARVNAIAMEVHPEHGDAEALCLTLEAAGFVLTRLTADLAPCPADAAPDFVYAARSVVRAAA